MKLTQSIWIGAFFLVILNLIMAFGSIWVFKRMAPAIEVIIEQNEKSLYACDEMLASLALRGNSEKSDAELESQFLAALSKARNNITEKEEPEAVREISQDYISAFTGNRASIQKTVAAIRHLRQLNRNAMFRADWKAKQSGVAGAWGIVFMASTVFLVAVLFFRKLRKNLISPLEEIHAVIEAVKSNDHMRRCSGTELPHDIQTVFTGINQLLDQHTASTLNKKNWKN